MACIKCNGVCTITTKYCVSNGIEDHKLGQRLTDVNEVKGPVDNWRNVTLH